MTLRSALRAIHIAVAWLLVITIVIQVFLAGLALASLGGSGNFDLHIDFGYTVVGLVALATVVTAVLAGLPRRDSLIAFGLLVLYVIQTILPVVRTSFPAIAALHPVNALLLFGGSFWYARHVSRRATEARPVAHPVQTELEPTVQ